MRLFNLALRNLFRNRRRSVATMLAIAVSAGAMVLFGGFISNIFLSFETNIVQFSGHLKVYRKGYFEFGAGRPWDFDLADYPKIIRLIKGDPQLKKLARLVTPVMELGGIVGNPVTDRSKTFFATGVVPDEFYDSYRWNDHHLRNPALDISRRPQKLFSHDPRGGIMGIRLAKLLKLCKGLAPTPCQKQKVMDFEDVKPSASKPYDPRQGGEDHRPQVNLLSSAGGTPNVLRLSVIQADVMGDEDFDSNYILMHLNLAQRLMYGPGVTNRATTVQLQLHHTKDLETARAALYRLFKQNGLAMEVKDYAEMWPQFKQVIGLFTTIFAFIAGVMGVVALFSVSNTVSMSVMERTHEIGTLRSMGLRRGGIMALFLLEGMLLGAIGATVGLLLGLGLAEMINHSGLHWQPPTQTARVPLLLEPLKNPTMIFGSWLVLLVATPLSALGPARMAARLKVVDALRH